MPLSEIKYLLKDAGETLVFIENSYQAALKADDVSIALKLKIKHFLEDVKSSLDYIAYYIFIEYCADNITSKLDDHIRNLYFPNKEIENKFNNYITSMYPGLNANHPEIVHIFRSVQSFNEIQWFINLNKLVNKNKHRELEKQQRNKTTHIHYGKIGGITLSNVKFVNCETPISYGGTAIDFESPSPYNSNFLANTTIEFIFKDLNLSVIPTLKDIYTGANKVINDLETIIF
ncbi:hypothetical protein [Peribacillus frigoritolerans]|uniref:hypothetical protein n=1 Tax=Peribacillus frigoritolerans TaxID=450367 RepID=UPI00207A02FA|nr:hypothetical protein [Peribacillus frigoritolerans]USK66314.1 hypothetical protein LIT26_06700 [Peribacillus frigoritolerans]